MERWKCSLFERRPDSGLLSWLIDRARVLQAHCGAVQVKGDVKVDSIAIIISGPHVPLLGNFNHQHQEKLKIWIRMNNVL